MASAGIGLKSRLTGSVPLGNVHAPRNIGDFMSKVCSVTNAKPIKGSVVHRRGLAKKKGGIGQHVTKVVPRTFEPNLKNKRIWVPELKKFVRVKLTARALKTVAKNGAFSTLKGAGVI